MSRLTALAAFGALSFAAMPASAQAPELAMLRSLEKGSYVLRFRDGEPPQRVCLRTGSELLQIGHPGLTCSYFTVKDGAKEVDVNYTCQGRGYGRNLVRKETDGLVQIDTQGIRGGMPFAWDVEARRTGSCR
ncbi:hypothetical protein QQS45_04340 [Alteriqipengyuania flavescens]|uniref:hypothetical protein n=1 Tax=Alteriqipengyuania flavescens TaxID=3053610 RepID=UPI0025B3DA6B|nr:hypothetical protein [Alteriqipengyuania flavescens]WJY19461.1 hypothetical protein QQW98_04335 [Alteriqipengyuania flavescens]WJY25403.1 hypothetical protein QQS45_04340 [Alteriqipengyuania flavescens]